MNLTIAQCEAMLARPRPPLPALAAAPILVAAAQAFAVSLPAMLGPGNARAEAHARFCAAGLIRSRLGYSTPHIGRLLRRDHSTIVHALRRAAQLTAADPDFAARMARVVATLDSKEIA